MGGGEQIGRIKKVVAVVGNEPTSAPSEGTSDPVVTALVGVFGFEPKLAASKAGQARLSAPHLLGAHHGIEPCSSGLESALVPDHEL